MFATPTVHKSGNSLHVSHGNDDGLFVEFYIRPIKNEFKTEAEGRPIFDDVQFIRILFPGDRNKSIDRPVKLTGSEHQPADNIRFARQWDAFKKGETQATSGTPLEEWSLLTRSEVAGLKALNIFSVEQLAAAPDTALNWLGGRVHRDKAKAYLEQAKGGAEISRLVSENTKLTGNIEMLNKQFKELNDKFLELTSKKTKEK